MREAHLRSGVELWMKFVSCREEDRGERKGLQSRVTESVPWLFSLLC